MKVVEGREMRLKLLPALRAAGTSFCPDDAPAAAASTASCGDTGDSGLDDPHPMVGPLQPRARGRAGGGDRAETVVPCSDPREGMTHERGCCEPQGPCGGVRALASALPACSRYPKYETRRLLTPWLSGGRPLDKHGSVRSDRLPWSEGYS